MGSHRDRDAGQRPRSRSMYASAYLHWAKWWRGSGIGGAEASVPFGLAPARWALRDVCQCGKMMVSMRMRGVTSYKMHYVKLCPAGLPNSQPCQHLAPAPTRR